MNNKLKVHFKKHQLITEIIFNKTLVLQQTLNLIILHLYRGNVVIAKA